MECAVIVSRVVISMVASLPFFCWNCCLPVFLPSPCFPPLRAGVLGLKAAGWAWTLVATWVWTP